MPTPMPLVDWTDPAARSHRWWERNGQQQDDAVVCVICGTPRHNLGRHLRLRHGITSETYREQYGAPVTSEHYRAQHRELMKDRLQESECPYGHDDAERWRRRCDACRAISDGERVWGQAAIIRALQRRARELGRTPGLEFWRDNPSPRPHPSAGQVKGAFGSWTAALEAAGLEPTHPGTPRKQRCKRGHLRPSGSPCPECRPIHRRRELRRRKRRYAALLAAGVPREDAIGLSCRSDAVVAAAIAACTSREGC